MATAAPVARRTTRAQRTKPQASKGRLDWATWPKYEAAVLGLRNYWYPVTWSRKIGRRPVPALLCGERLSLVREAAGTVRVVRVGVDEPGAADDVAYASYPAEERLGIVWVFMGDG